MKRYYRNRIMLSAMLSFLIILIIAVAGIWLFSYRQIEQNTDSFIASRLEPREEKEEKEERTPRFRQEATPAMFGYTPGRRNIPSGFYEITFTADGELDNISKFGISEDASAEVQAYVQDVVKKDTEKGKIGSYKFGIRRNEDGSGTIVLVDNSIQLHMLYDMLKSAGLVGLGIFLLLIIVLFPVSNRMADIFVRNAEQQRQFITDAGHDLKTPVAIARANLDVLELREGPNKWSSNVRAQVDRMEHLVQDLILMARLDEEKSEEALNEINLTTLADEIWEEYQPSMKQKQIAGVTALEETAPIRGTGSLIRRMLCLLMDNAVQYTPEEGSIRLSVEPDRKKVRIVLENHVAQLPSEKPEKLTERFVRGDSARTQKNGGSGIGLAAVRRICEKHHGKLVIDYPDEHTFRVKVEV
ncbi:MAG: HAMP domain-containing histidine kinase [Clostridiales bacterium]|nr:HAMP domain-containing histidine kinase [Clostridiales bacterium]